MNPGPAALAWALAAVLAPAPAVAGPSAAALFAEPELRQLQLSPDGELLASISRKAGWDRVLVRRREGGGERVALRRLHGIRRLDWLDASHLLVAIGLAAQPTYHIAIVSPAEDGIAVETRRVRLLGRLVQRLPGRDGSVLWALRARGETSVYRVGLERLLAREAESRREPPPGPRVATLPGEVLLWVADVRGQLRAALRVLPGSPRRAELLYREAPDAAWTRLLEAAEIEQVPVPLGLAENGRDLIVASRRGRDTWGLFELAPGEPGVGRELFSLPDADVVDVVYDHRGTTVIGAVYEREGLETRHYFDSFYAHHQQALQRALPGVALEIVGVSAEKRFFAVRTGGPRDPGTFYVVEPGRYEATRVGRALPGLAPEALVPVRPLRVASPGGVELDVFVALPDVPAGPPPLLVLPHGGPSGVRDTRAFDPLVQFLAGAGIAVLQVNYRGSGGRGESFLEAGKRQWARGIEDDLDAAVDRVVALGWVDGDRICIAGGSYGGYSALISAVRRPDRYRCAASLNGPTDLPLLYHFGLFGAGPELRAFFREHVGDPERDHEALLSISPAYRAPELRARILLVHGSADARVDLEHYYRMLAALEAAGVSHETHVIEGGGHALTRRQWIGFATRLRAFLLRSLDRENGATGGRGGATRRSAGLRPPP